jgi:hypothetical protein
LVPKNSLVHGDIHVILWDDIHNDYKRNINMFLGDVNLWARVTHEVHVHKLPTNKDDSTVFGKDKLPTNNDDSKVFYFLPQ